MPIFSFCGGRELFLFLHFDTVFWNSTPKTADIWRIEREGLSARKFEAAQLHFLSDVFVAVAVAVAVVVAP